MLTNSDIATAIKAIAGNLTVLADVIAKQSPDKPQVSAAKAMKLPAKTKLGDLPITTVKLSNRHLTIIAKFRRMGIKNPQLFTDIKTFDLWSADGFVPKKGQHGVHGLFHRSQVQPAG